MALYVPPARRRRRLVLVASACLLVGIGGGYLVGQASVTTTSEQVARVQADGDQIATRIEALTIEYEQAVNGTGDTIQGGVLQPLQGIEREVQRVLAAAIWLGPTARDTVNRAIGDVRAAAGQKALPDDFADRTAAAAAAIRTTLGVETPATPDGS
jgi:hypothetical protein